MKPDCNRTLDALACQFVRCFTLDEAPMLHVQPAPSLEDFAQLLRGAGRTTPSSTGKTRSPVKGERNE
jgi:hypothetical protein